MLNVPKRIRVDMKDGIMSANVFDADTGERLTTVIDVRLHREGGRLVVTFYGDLKTPGPSPVTAEYNIKSLELETY